MVKKAYLTPSTFPEGVFERCLKIPASQEWLGVVNSALLEMTHAYNYEQLEPTHLTPEDAAAIAYQIYTNYLLGDCAYLDCSTVNECLPDLEQVIIRRGNTNPDIVDKDDTQVIETRFPPEVRDQPVIETLPDCDKDVLFGSVREIATRIDAAGLDFWQIAVSNVDPIERMADILDAVPILQNLASPVLRSFAQNADTLREKYEAHQTLGLVDEIACDLFTLVCQDCRYPTYAEVLQYYAALGIVGMEQWAQASLQLIVDLLLSTTTSTNALVYYSTNAMLLYLRGVGATVMGKTGIPFIKEWAILGSDSPSSDHELLCPCAPATWSHSYFSGDGNSPFTIVEWLGFTASYDSGNDRIEGACQGANEADLAALTFNHTGFQLDRIVLEFQVYKTRGPGTPDTVGNLYINGISRATVTNANTGVPYTKTIDHAVTYLGVTDIRIEGFSRINTCGDAGYWRLTKLTVYGTGLDPFA